MESPTTSNLSKPLKLYRPDLDTISHDYSFLGMPVEPFGFNKDTQIIHKLVQRQRTRRGLTCNQISMPLSQKGLT
ncbi:Galactokinase [Gossypium arboreum]|uniref:Galactokinase n=1 Tax=Gossypium arboreum TaxID=29729 RepID=A0A0B0N958_GOSAR|nr:Galactokinase [Gossypium arboreum]